MDIEISLEIIILFIFYFIPWVLLFSEKYINKKEDDLLERIIKLETEKAKEE